jgi:DNA-binding NarL/FixJ family response regulator
MKPVDEGELMIRVVLVNAIRILCNVIAAVLENEPDIEIVGCATTADEALDLARRCDVLVVSRSFPIASRDRVPARFDRRANIS